MFAEPNLYDRSEMVVLTMSSTFAMVRSDDELAHERQQIADDFPRADRFRSAPARGRGAARGAVRLDQQLGETEN